METRRDYYDVLGVSKTVSEAEIKRAYRKLAREHHPDMVKEDDKKHAEERFKEINEAYQVLSDPEKKGIYDQFGHVGNGAPFGGFSQGQREPFTYTYTSTGGSPFGDFDPFDIFEEVFGFRGFGKSTRPRKGKNLYYKLRVSFEDAVKGCEKSVNIEGKEMKIKIPKGARNGTELRFSGKGAPGPQGTPSGDLYISLRVLTPKEFRRSGDHLGTSIEINFIQAILGDTVGIPVIDPESKGGIGMAKLKIPAGTQPETQFRLRGKGMSRIRGSGRGDVIVQVFVKIPKRLSKKQKKILEEYIDQR